MWPDIPPYAVSPVLTRSHTEAARSPASPRHVLTHPFAHSAECSAPHACSSALFKASYASSASIQLCFSDLVSPTCSVSLNLYLQPLSYTYPLRSLTSLLSFLREYDVAYFAIPFTYAQRTHLSFPPILNPYTPSIISTFVITAEGD